MYKQKEYCPVCFLRCLVPDIMLQPTTSISLTNRNRIKNRRRKNKRISALRSKSETVPDIKIERKSVINPMTCGAKPYHQSKPELLLASTI